MIYNDKTKEELIIDLQDLKTKYADLNTLYQKAEERLEITNKIFQEKEQVYKTLFDTSNDAVFIMENELFIDCNYKALSLFKCQTEDLIGKTPLEFSPKYQDNGELSSSSATKKVKLAIEGTPQQFEWKHQTADGEHFDAEVSLFRIFIKNKPYLQAIVRDISYRHKSEEKYKMLLEFASDAFFQGDKEGKLLLTNNKALELTGYSKNELLGMEMEHLFPEETLKDKPLRYDLLQEGKSIKIERELLKKNGETLPVEMYSKQMPDGTFQSFFRDISKRRIAEKKLKESEERKKAILDAIPDLMLVMDKTGVFIDYNRDDNPYLIPPDQFLGKNISELFPAEISELTHAHLKILFETGKMQVYNYHLENNGEICYYECRLVLHGSEKSLAIIRDITRQKKSEEALMESEERYRNMLHMLRLITDNAKDFLWAKDMDNKYIFTNKTICDRLLMAKDTVEPIGKTDLFFAQRERDMQPDNPEWHTFGEICANTDYVVHEEKKTKQFDEYGNIRGKFLFLDVMKSPIWDSNGNMIGVVGTGRDVTKEKELEQNEEKFVEALIESENRYRAVVSNTPIISFVLDNKGVFILSDGKGLIKLGLKPSQIVGLSVYDVYKDYPVIIDSINKCLSGQSIRNEVNVEGIVFDVFYSPAFDNEGNITKVIGVGTDITERKQFETLLHEKNIAYENQNIELRKAKEKAEESDRLKSSFLANLSHEIRTPMNAILGFTDLLKKAEFSADRRDSFISIIHKSGNYLLSIINDIIEISKIDSGQISVNKSSVEINSLLEELNQSIGITIPKDKNISLAIQLPEPKLDRHIITDPIKLRQILVNLINNAVKFTEEGFVKFGYEIIDDTQLSFFVEDTGIGIDKKHHKIIFERFRQVEGDTAIKKGGSGLGLAISRAYAEMLGGKLSFTSEPDKGSLFRFYIPLEFQKIKSIDPENSKINGEKSSSDSSELILIVEDDDINYFFFEELFSETNYSIMRAKDGLQAVEIASNNDNIQLVLMDIKMPKMNGFEALKKIKDIRPELPVIAQTSYALYDDIVKINQAGFDDYISKPIVREKLMEIIKTNLCQS